MEWSKDTKALIWTEIVTDKIRKQKEFLQDLGRDEADMLSEYIEQIEVGDVTNREGHAAKVYFNAVFGMDFTRSLETQSMQLLIMAILLFCQHSIVR